MSSEPSGARDARPASRAVQVEAARTVALNQLSTRDRSTAELRRVMARRGIPEDVADEVLERLAEVGLVDDAAFAEGLASSRMTHGLRGRHRIRQELAEKGVSREQAAEVLAQLDPQDEVEAARRFAEKRARSLASLERQVAYRRLGAALVRRGFPGHVVEQVLAEVFAEWGSANL